MVIPTRGNELYFLFFALVPKQKREVNFHHSTYNASKIGRQVGTESLCTRNYEAAWKKKLNFSVLSGTLLVDVVFDINFSLISSDFFNNGLDKRTDKGTTQVILEDIFSFFFKNEKLLNIHEIKKYSWIFQLILTFHPFITYSYNALRKFYSRKFWIVCLSSMLIILPYGLLIW